MFHSFVTYTVGGERWSVSRLRPLYPRLKARGTSWIEGLVDPRADPDAVVKIKYFHCRESTRGHPTCSLIFAFTELRGCPTESSLHLTPIS
jgi:hypothetical protein